MSDTPPPAAPDPPAEDPPLDRTISPIAGRRLGGVRGKLLTFAGLLVGCAVFAFATWSADRPRTAHPPTLAARQVVAFEPAEPPPILARPAPAPPRLTRDDPVVPAIEPTPAEAAGLAGPPPGAGPAPVRAAPLMAYSRARPDGPSDLPAPERAVAAPAPTPLDQLRQGSRIGRARAHTLGDRNFLILAGTVIPCVLQTGLDSATPGYASCLVPSDVYSDNGAVVLLGKGTRVLGEYRGSLRQGQTRIFVLWTRAVTPDGVAIELSSPASDALGRGGFDGALDTHFWDRFGAAVLLSVVDGGAAAVTSDHSGVARLPSDAAGLAVEKDADIGPTLRKPPGAEVAIFAAEDFDFSGVYGVKAPGP